MVPPYSGRPRKALLGAGVSVMLLVPDASSTSYAYVVGAKGGSSLRARLCGKESARFRGYQSVQTARKAAV